MTNLAQLIPLSIAAVAFMYAMIAWNCRWRHRHDASRTAALEAVAELGRSIELRATRHEVTEANDNCG